MNIKKVNLKNYLTDNFERDCPVAKKLPKKFIHFDKVRKDIYSQLRSVDFVDIYNNRIYLYEITTFKDFIKEKIDKKKKTTQINIKNTEECLKEEYRSKFFESLFLLTILDENPNRRQIIFKILSCDENFQRNVYGYTGFLKILFDSIKQKGDKFVILPIDRFVGDLNNNNG